MIRRRIRNNDLVFEDYIIGKETKTKISIAYIQGIVNENILKRSKKRIDNIDIDGILESGYIEQLIEDSHISLISTIGNTQNQMLLQGNC